MENKPAQIVLQIAKAGDPGNFWKSFLSTFDPSDVDLIEANTLLVARLTVKSYDMSDHQFLRIKAIWKGKEGVIFIPRQHVVAIIEGKDLKRDDFYFVPCKT